MAFLCMKEIQVKDKMSAKEEHSHALELKCMGPPGCAIESSKIYNYRDISCLKKRITNKKKLSLLF